MATPTVTRVVLVILLAAATCCHSFQIGTATTFSTAKLTRSKQSALNVSKNVNSNNNDDTTSSRRQWLVKTSSSAAAIFASTWISPENSFAASGTTKVTTNSDGNMPDLPPDAARSYLQYRTALQTAADYYVFELWSQINDTEQWGDVSQIFQTSAARGAQGQPSRIERNFVNPMRILGLSMPPDVSDELRDSQLKFEAAMQRMSKAVAGVRRDLPVEISSDALPTARTAWDDGRKALNEFFTTVNDATGLTGELKLIPTASSNLVAEYPRSSRRYFDLMKKTKLCQNRGGPTLSQTWGQLMISGMMQDACGIPDLDEYFFQ